MDTPVAFIIFNRPDNTRRVLTEIAKARPKKLLVIADGPRISRAGEAELCSKTRTIIDGIDWDCEVLTHYSDVNLGCKNRLSTGIDWVFDTVEEAIILEDDCLPHPSFFPYCEALLARYRDDDRVMCISGDNFQFDKKRNNYSYYFSRYTHIWGWASWRRAWKHYDVSIKIWPEVKENGWLRDAFNSDIEARYWTRIFDSVYRGEIDTWDYQWLFTSLMNNGLNIIPGENLVSNIGFGADSTHTSTVNQFSNMNVRELSFPLVHPPCMTRSSDADKYTEKLQFSGALPYKIWNKFTHAIKR